MQCNDKGKDFQTHKRNTTNYLVNTARSIFSALKIQKRKNLKKRKKFGKQEKEAALTCEVEII